MAHSGSRHIPVVDIGPLNLSSTTRDVIKSWTSCDAVVNDIAHQIIQAFTDIGFVYLVNHGISQNTIERATDVTEGFFTLPPGVKAKYRRVWPGGSNNGWTGLQQERLDLEKAAGYKESYNVLPRIAQFWPDEEVAGFKDAVLSIHSDCVTLTYVVLMLIGIGLKLEDPAYFVKCHNIETEDSFTTLRFLYYPAVPKEIKVAPGAIRCGEHSDFGTLTLLFQDLIGGLQVKLCDGEFVSATPVPGSIIVNVGDFLQRWTADKLVSTASALTNEVTGWSREGVLTVVVEVGEITGWTTILPNKPISPMLAKSQCISDLRHRVLIPDSEVESQQTRRSMAFFVQPDDNAIISCIDGSDKYPPIGAADYTSMKLDDAKKLDY